MHLKTYDNFAAKCVIFASNFQTFSGRGHSPLLRPHPYPSAPYSQFLDPPLAGAYSCHISWVTLTVIK